MIGYLIRRVVQAVIVVIGVCLITFGLYHLFPGGAVSEARIILGPRATAGSIQLFIDQNGLDKPIWIAVLHPRRARVHLQPGLLLQAQ